MKILLAWIGADAPIPEADIRPLAACRGTTVQRVLGFLDAKGMVIPDPDRKCPVERTLRSTNPYLLVSQITAADSNHPPIAHTLTDAIFQRPAEANYAATASSMKHTTPLTPST